jgi:pimeloyl-ACP methyl ester carboxylesterase
MNVRDIAVPGATLHVYTQGSGPAVLVIPGAPADSYVFAGLAEALAGSYTVSTVELRGLSRSPVDGELGELTPDVFADDVAALLDQIADGPVDVVGASGGGVVGLDLAARYPRKVGTLVAHEPPCAAVLPNGDAWIAFFDECHETAKTAGAGPAMGRFIASFDGYDGPERDDSKGAPPPFPLPDFSNMSPQEVESFQRMGQNSEVFMSHMIRHTPRYVPNYEALQGSGTRIVIAVGETSDGQLPNRTGRVIAERLGLTPAVFPGDHQGFGTHTKEWAASVEAALRG